MCRKGMWYRAGADFISSSFSTKGHKKRQRCCVKEKWEWQRWPLEIQQYTMSVPIKVPPCVGGPGTLSIPGAAEQHREQWDQWDQCPQLGAAGKGCLQNCDRTVAAHSSAGWWHLQEAQTPALVTLPYPELPKKWQTAAIRRTLSLQSDLDLPQPVTNLINQKAQWLPALGKWFGIVLGNSISAGSPRDFSTSGK